MTPKSNTRVWRAIRQTVGRMDRTSVAVGVFSGARHHSGLDIAELALFHELGTSTVPPRSFIRSTLREKAAEIGRLYDRLMGRVVEGLISSETAMSTLGKAVAAMIREKIRSTNIPPPLKPETIRRKGSSKPLVDTGQLVGAISHRVGVK